MKKILLLSGLLILAAACNKTTASNQTSTALTDAQTNCSSSAAKYYANNNVMHTDNSDPEDTHSYTNHFNTSLNKCFIEMHENNLEVSTLNNSDYLVDVYDNKVIAYTLYPAPSYNQPKPGCNSVEDTFTDYMDLSCADLASFNSYIQPYMTN